MPRKGPEMREWVFTAPETWSPAPQPPTRRKDRPPVHGPCEACGTLVVVGQTLSGTRLALDLRIKTSTILWHHEAQPVLQESRGYPVHQCGARGVAPEAVS